LVPLKLVEFVEPALDFAATALDFAATALDFAATALDFAATALDFAATVFGFAISVKKAMPGLGTVCATRTPLVQKRWKHTRFVKANGGR